MGSIYIKKCDKCGAEARNDTQKKEYDGYVPITLAIEDRYTSLRATNYSIILCPVCLKKIGIAPKEEGKFSTEENETIKDRLYDIFAEIIAEMRTE